MPFYNSLSVSTALNVSPKWLDNLLSHHSIAGVQQAKQGIPRRLSTEAIEIIAIARSLTEATNLPMLSALTLAHSLCTTQDASVDLTPFLSISLNIHHFRQSLTQHLAHATEITPQPSRGRPPKHP
jgi:hypothetical protein